MGERDRPGAALTRREAVAAALRAGASAAVTCSLAPALAACAGARRPAPPVASRTVLSLGALAPALARDAGSTLDALRAAGAELVELPSPQLAVGWSAARLRKALDAAGLAAASARVGTGRLYRGWERTLDAAATLRCPALTCSSPQPDERPTARDWAELGELFARAGEAAARARVELRVLVDAAWAGLPGGGDPLRIVLRATEAAPVAFVVDTRGTASAPEDAVTLLRKGGRRVRGVVVDGSEGPGAPALAAARAAGAEEWIVAVADADRGGPPFARVREALARVRGVHHPSP